MIGLLLKDYYVIKDSLYSQLIMALFIGIGLSMAISPVILIVNFILTLGLNASASIATDKSDKWDMFSRTIPVAKSTVVSSKYVLNLLMVILGIVLGSFFTIIMAMIMKTPSLDTNQILEFVMFGIAVNFVSSSVSIPASIILDSSKQVLTMLFSMLFTVAVFIAGLLGANQFMNIKENMIFLTGIYMIIGVIIYVASWLMMPKVLERRDL